MKKVEPIREILKRVIASGYLKGDAFPISCLLIGNVGGGRSQLLKELSVNHNIIYVTDLTPFGFTKIYNDYKEAIGKGEITHIMIPDLIVPFSRSSKIVSNFIGFMNALIEEGIYKIKTFYIEINTPIKMGLISTTTRSDFNRRKTGWLGIGFMSRLLPISYAYTEVDRIQILQDIAHGKIVDFEETFLKLEKKDIEGSEEIYEKLVPYVDKIDKQFYTVTRKGDMIPLEKPEPFRRLKQLMILLKANALLRGDDKVTEEDLKWYTSVANWINYDFRDL